MTVKWHSTIFYLSAFYWDKYYVYAVYSNHFNRFCLLLLALVAVIGFYFMS